MMTWGLAIVWARRTNVRTLRPAASSDFTKLVRSISYHLPAVPETVVLASVDVPAAGRVFQVSAFSSQAVLSDDDTVTTTPPDIASESLPYSRSFAEVAFARLERSKRSHDS